MMRRLCILMLCCASVVTVIAVAAYAHVPRPPLWDGRHAEALTVEEATTASRMGINTPAARLRLFGAAWLAKSELHRSAVAGDSEAQRYLLLLRGIK